MKNLPESSHNYLWEREIDLETHQNAPGILSRLRTPSIRLAKLTEGRVEDWGQHLMQSLLDQTVHHRWDAELAHSFRGGVRHPSRTVCVSVNHRESRLLLHVHVRAFSRIERPIMPSADFCQSIGPPLGGPSTGQIDRSPRVMRTHLHTYARRIYVRAFRTGIGLQRHMTPYPARPPRIRFLFVKPVLCLRLPSDPTSRWQPLPFG